MKALSRTLAVLAIAVLAISYSILAPTISRTQSTVILAVKNGVEVAMVLPDNTTTRQQKLLNFAYDIAKADGYKKPQWLQGIIMQESKAGGMREYRVAGLQNKVGDRYFGVSQIKLAAAKDVMGKHPELWKHLDTKTDEELQARLVLDDEFNIRVASKYALMMGINQNASRGITAYNQGAAGAVGIDSSTHHYNIGVERHVKNVQVTQSMIKSKDKLLVASH